MFDKASIIKAVTQVSLIVIAGVVLYFIIGAIDKKRCNCGAPEMITTTDANGNEVVIQPAVTK
jgi:hypothetical protein